MTLLSITLVLLAQTSPEAKGTSTSSPAKEQAQVLLDQGSVLYREGDFEGALAKFNQAYQVYPSPKLWFDIGQAENDLHRPVEALQAFERFLATPSDAPPDAVRDARTAVADLQGKLGALRIQCPNPGAEIELDGKALGPAPLPAPVWALPGRHTLTARRGATLSDNKAHTRTVDGTVDRTVDGTVDRSFDGTVEKTIELAPGVTDTVVLELPQARPSPRFARQPADVARSRAPSLLEPTPPHGWWLGRRWTWVAAGAAVLSAGGAVTFGLLMQSKFDDLDKSCGKGSAAWPGCSPADFQSLDRRKTAANVLWGVAGAAAATAAILFVLEGRAKGHPVSVSASAGESMALSTTVRF